MSRIAKAPVELPAGVTATIAADAVTIKGAKGSLSLPLTAGVSVVQTDKKLQIRFDAEGLARPRAGATRDRKSTRLNSSHRCISYAVFCLKKKNKKKINITQKSKYQRILILTII